MLPDGWEEQSLSSVCQIFTGGTPNRGIPEYWNGDIPWMSSGEINQKVIWSVEQRITSLGMANSNARLLAPGTVMMALNGQGKTRGKVALLKIETTCNQSLAGIVPDGRRLLPEYLLYSLDSQYQAIRNITGDDARNGLNLAILRKLRVALPPLDEQRRIAEVLRSVDEAIAAAVVVQETTSSLLRSVRHNAFSDAKERVDFASVITLVSGQHVDTEQCNKVGLGVPYLTGPSDFPDGEIIVTKFTTTPSVMCQPGDILVTVKGSGVGKAVIADSSYCISRQLMAIRSNELPTAFLFEALQMVVEELNTEASGPIPGITRGHILVKPIPVMEQSAQESLAATFRSLREQLRFANEHLELLGVFKSSLMSDLLSGHVLVPA